MEEYLNSIIQIEWKAQQLIADFKERGPLLTIIRDFSKNKSAEHLLVIQGSFDPPLLSHIELINQALSLFQKKLPQARVSLMVLLSLSHVEKDINLLSRTLLGLRVEMLERLLIENNLDIPWMIGLSNSGRYIDLTHAINRFFEPSRSITYVMGIDVFDKLFQGVYYSKPLKVILPKIFEADYIVAGREEVSTVDDFNSYLQSLPKESQNEIKVVENVLFLPLNKKYQYESSTKVRKQFLSDPTAEIPLLHPKTTEFIHNIQLYTKNQKTIIRQIIIQIFIRILINRFNHPDTAKSIIQQGSSEILDSKEDFLRILDEYKKNENKFLETRCLELIKDLL